MLHRLLRLLSMLLSLFARLRDDAIRLMQRAIDAEPYDEHRYVRLADLLASQGRDDNEKTALGALGAALLWGLRLTLAALLIIAAAGPLWHPPLATTKARAPVRGGALVGAEVAIIT